MLDSSRRDKNEGTYRSAKGGGESLLCDPESECLLDWEAERERCKDYKKGGEVAVFGRKRFVSDRLGSRVWTYRLVLRFHEYQVHTK